VEKTLTFSGQCIGFLVLMQKNPIFANKTMDLSQHLALGTRQYHWRTLGPLPYNLNLFAINQIKPDFARPQMIGFLKKLLKNPSGASLATT